MILIENAELCINCETVWDSNLNGCCPCCMSKTSLNTRTVLSNKGTIELKEVV